jgi:hypothetical protein
MAAKAKKGHFPNTTTPVTQERVPMPSLKIKKQKKTSRGK